MGRCSTSLGTRETRTEAVRRHPGRMATLGTTGSTCRGGRGARGTPRTAGGAATHCSAARPETCRWGSPASCERRRVHPHKPRWRGLPRAAAGYGPPLAETSGGARGYARLAVETASRPGGRRGGWSGCPAPPLSQHPCSFRR